MHNGDMKTIFKYIFVIGLGCILPGANICHADTPTPNDRSGQCRVILNCDEFNLFRYQLRWLKAKLGRDPQTAEVKAMLEQIVDEHAQAKVDRLVQCLFSLPWGASPPGFETFNRAPQRGFLEGVPGMPGFEDAGHD
jgi:hypothetical protein